MSSGGAAGRYDFHAGAWLRQAPAFGGAVFRSRTLSQSHASAFGRQRPLHSYTRNWLEPMWIMQKEEKRFYGSQISSSWMLASILAPNSKYWDVGFIFAPNL